MAGVMKMAMKDISEHNMTVTTVKEGSGYPIRLKNIIVHIP